MNNKTVKVQIATMRGTPLPVYETVGSAGMDLRAADDYIIHPGVTLGIRTGIRVSIPSGYEAQIRSRSGLALKDQITVANAPGTIDSDFTGEIKVILHNSSCIQFAVDRGDRIAQIVFAPVSRVEWDVVDELPPTERGVGGFGSTGVSDKAVDIGHG